MTEKKEAAARLGRDGENWVRQVLERRGVTILAQNWRCRWGEIDLIAATDTHVRFVEVKTRRSDAFARGVEAVDRRKRKKLTRTAQCWLQRHPREQRLLCFDVAEVYLREDGFRMRYFADAFEAEE